MKQYLKIAFLAAMALFITFVTTSCTDSFDSILPEDRPNYVITEAKGVLDSLESYSYTSSEKLTYQVSGEKKIDIASSEDATEYRIGKEGYTSQIKTSFDGQVNSENITYEESIGYTDGLLFYEFKGDGGCKSFKSEVSYTDYHRYASMKSNKELNIEELCDLFDIKSGRKIKGEGYEVNFTDITDIAKPKLERLLFDKHEYIDFTVEISNAQLILKTNEDFEITSVFIELFFGTDEDSGERSSINYQKTVNYYDMGNAKRPQKDISTFEYCDSLICFLKLPLQIEGYIFGSSTSVTVDGFKKISDSDGNKVSSYTTKKNKIDIKNSEYGFSYFLDVPGSLPNTSSYTVSYSGGGKTAKTYEFNGSLRWGQTLTSNDFAERLSIHETLDKMHFHPSMIVSIERISEKKIRAYLDFPLEFMEHNFIGKDSEIISSTMYIDLWIEDGDMSYYLQVLNIEYTPSESDPDRKAGTALESTVTLP